MRNPYEDDFALERTDTPEDHAESEHRYPCACGNPECIADDRDEGNFKIRGEWYASDCKIANSHPDVVGDVMAAIKADEFQDEFNRTRR